MTIMQIICSGELVNKHSAGHHGWSNPIDFIPRVGDIIDYMTFDEPHYKNGEGVLTSYQVKSVSFYTREAMNNSYKDKVCIIEVKVLK